MEKKFPFFKILTLLVWLVLGMGTAFAANCAADYVAPENLVWDGTSIQEPCQDPVDRYYVIDNAEKLAWYAKNYGNGNAKLTADIDLGGKLWTPIAPGNGDKKYAKTFDGNNHTIKNLYINGAELAAIDINYAQNLGFVGSLGGGTIKNLVLVPSEIYGTTSAGETTINKPISVGTLVGWIASGTVTNCVVEGNITTSGNVNRVGGLVGNAWNARISDCVSKVSILASGEGTHVGGIVGALRSDKNSVSTVYLSSCVFDGDTLISTGGEVGGIIGNYEKATVATQENLYYSGNYSGVGAGNTVSTVQKDDPNTEDVICALNKGTWDNDTKTCSNATSDVWSEGQSDISMNGSDGYKITFNANGGTFASGAKTSKILAKNAIITADEIGVPTREGKKFGGWATTANAADTASDLGVAHAATTIYAVWYDFYEVTFEINSVTHATNTISIPKHGFISAEGISVPESYTDPDDSEKKYFFTGWAYETKWLAVNTDPSPTDTLHLADIDVIQDTALFPVWTRAETYSVTFDATLHGMSHVWFVKKVPERDTVAEPGKDDIVADPGYKIVGWCTNSGCIEGSKYNFSTKLESNLTLYAKWELEEYPITYELNGNADNGNNPTSYTVESDPITFAEPTYPGYTFKGWFYDEGFTNPATGIATNSTSGEKTLYAKWEQIVYTVEYLSGNDVSAIIVADRKGWNETITLKGDEVAFQRNGYIHDGWSLTPGGNIAYNFGAPYKENKDLVLYPHWVEGSPVAHHYGAVTIYEYTNETVAEINGEYTGADPVNIPEAIQVDRIIINRTFTQNTPATIVLPFTLPDGTNLNGAKFYYLKNVVQHPTRYAWKATMKWIGDGALPSANTPYLVVCTKENCSSLEFGLNGEKATFKTKELDWVKAEETDKWYFVGNYVYKTWESKDEQKELADGLVYGIAGQNDDGVPKGTFAKATSSANVVYPMRAYMRKRDTSVKLERVTQAQTVRARGASYGLNNIGSEIIEVEFVDDEKTTAIGRMNTVTGEIKIDRWFDLKGRHVKNVNRAAKGAYYGKKVFHE